METKFTKGEWITDGTHVLSSKGNVLASTFDDSNNGVNLMDVKEAEANAKLIAAAPDMLDALKTAVLVMPNGHSRNECLAAIKKATE